MKNFFIQILSIKRTFLSLFCVSYASSLNCQIKYHLSMVFKPRLFTLESIFLSRYLAILSNAGDGRSVLFSKFYSAGGRTGSARPARVLRSASALRFYSDKVSTKQEVEAIKIYSNADTC